VVLPRRWVVERALAWLSRYRRLSKDYERLTEYSESIIYIASIHILLKRLAPDDDEPKPYAKKAVA
jgi:putative transposase